MWRTDGPTGREQREGRARYRNPRRTSKGAASERREETRGFGAGVPLIRKTHIAFFSNTLLLVQQMPLSRGILPGLTWESPGSRKSSRAPGLAPIDSDLSGLNVA